MSYLLHLVSCYIVLHLLITSDKGKNKGKYEVTYMKCFKIDSIGYGWFEFRIGMYYVETSDFLGYDMPTEFLNKLIKVLKGSSKEWVYVMNEPGADILEILRSDNMITVNSYSMNKPSTELSSEIEEELKNIGEHEFSISINIPELMDAVVTEYSLYENGNGRKCFDLNWGGYPQKEYDELKRIAIEINKNQGKYDKLNCIEFLKS